MMRVEVQDVTEEHALEKTRSDFVANASHELRSPLTVISGYLETLAQDPALEAELQGPIAEMRRQAERMTAIIRDLLELSRLEETEEIVGGQPIDVAALAALLRKDVLARPVHPREVRVRVDSPAQLIGDEPEIHSAFSNLVDNLNSSFASGLTAAGITFFAAGMSLASLVGRDRPALLARLLARLRCLVSGDTGVAHLAAAVGTPIVSLFAPVVPALRSYWLVVHVTTITISSGKSDPRIIPKVS